MYALSATKTTQAFLTIIQPKKRSNTLSQYWYGDPSMILLRRIKTGSGGHEWECVACFLSGVKRQCHVDVFLEAGSTYFCLPFSCLACRKNNKHGALPFRMATYSSETVSIQSLPIDSDQSLVARNAATKLIHRNLLSKSLLLYPVSRTSMFTCIHGEGSVYFLAVNSSDDNFLSLRLTLDVPDGLLVVFGKEEDTYDVEPTSQRILAVVAGNGKQSLATEFKFRYTSSLVPVASSPLLSSQTGRHSIRRSGNQTPALNGSSHLGSDIVLSMAGDLLTMSSDDSLIQMAGSGTIDTYLWIPQLGASGILKNNFDGSF